MNPFREKIRKNKESATVEMWDAKSEILCVSPISLIVSTTHIIMLLNFSFDIVGTLHF